MIASSGDRGVVQYCDRFSGFDREGCQVGSEWLRVAAGDLLFVCDFGANRAADGCGGGTVCRDALGTVVGRLGRPLGLFGTSPKIGTLRSSFTPAGGASECKTACGGLSVVASLSSLCVKRSARLL